MEVCLQASILKFCYDHSQSLMRSAFIMVNKIMYNVRAKAPFSDEPKLCQPSNVTFLLIKSRNGLNVRVWPAFPKPDPTCAGPLADAEGQGLYIIQYRHPNKIHEFYIEF